MNIYDYAVIRESIILRKANNDGQLVHLHSYCLHLGITSARIVH